MKIKRIILPVSKKWHGGFIDIRDGSGRLIAVVGKGLMCSKDQAEQDADSLIDAISAYKLN